MALYKNNQSPQIKEEWEVLEETCVELPKVAENCESAHAATPQSGIGRQMKRHMLKAGDKEQRLNTARLAKTNGEHRNKDEGESCFVLKSAAGQRGEATFSKCWGQKNLST